MQPLVSRDLAQRYPIQSVRSLKGKPGQNVVRQRDTHTRLTNVPMSTGPYVLLRSGSAKEEDGEL